MFFMSPKYSSSLCVSVRVSSHIRINIHNLIPFFSLPFEFKWARHINILYIKAFEKNKIIICYKISLQIGSWLLTPFRYAGAPNWPLYYIRLLLLARYTRWIGWMDWMDGYANGETNRPHIDTFFIHSNKTMNRTVFFFYDLFK